MTPRVPFITSLIPWCDEDVKGRSPVISMINARNRVHIPSSVRDDLKCLKMVGADVPSSGLLNYY